VVSRNVDPLESAVLTVAELKGGDALNVIAAKAEIGGTIRTFSPQVRALLERRVRQIVDLVARAYDATATIDWLPGYPVTVNDPARAAMAAAAAASVTTADRVDTKCAPGMVSEDFSFMLQTRPGAIAWIGNGQSAALHDPQYDFNDDGIPYGISYWARLVEMACRA
jgi:hippurate hydrolase